MKRMILTLMLASLLLGMLSFGANAKIKESSVVGTVVYIPYSDKVPDMTEGSIDETWGDVVIHIDKKTKNAGMFAPMINSTTRGNPDDVEVDMYCMFDDEYIYFAFYSEDKNVLGSYIPWQGDSVSLMMEIDNPKLTYICPDDPERQGMDHSLGYGMILDGDDYTAEAATDTMYEPSMVEVRGAYYVKFGVPFADFGIKKSDLEEGISINVNLCRNSATYVEANGYDGWLYWGKVFDQSYGEAPYYVADSPNADGPNTFILKKSNTKGYVADKLLSDTEYQAVMGGSAPAEEPKEETPVTTTEKPSSWAADEVNAAISLGLVPTDLQKGYTQGITRGQLALMLSSLLTKAGVTLPTSGNASFTDTTDANVLAAANLGIINGYKQSDGTYMFKPNNTLKRSEMSAIINRVAKLCGKTTTGFEKEVTFTDTASHWCNSELGYPVHMGIVKGTSATTFSPENTLTVEQTIMMVYRTLNALKK